MNKKILTAIRDMLNILAYAGILMAVTYYLYIMNPPLAGLKNTIFPLNAALLVCIIITLPLVLMNRVTTHIALKIMEKRQ